MEGDDYTATPDLFGFADTHVETPSSLSFPLNSNGIAQVSTTLDNQFRVTLLPAEFSNFDGELGLGWTGGGAVFASSLSV